IVVGDPYGRRHPQRSGRGCTRPARGRLRSVAHGRHAGGRRPPERRPRRERHARRHYRPARLQHRQGDRGGGERGNVRHAEHHRLHLLGSVPLMQGIGGLRPERTEPAVNGRRRTGGRGGLGLLGGGGAGVGRVPRRTTGPWGRRLDGEPGQPHPEGRPRRRRVLANRRGEVGPKGLPKRHPGQAEKGGATDHQERAEARLRVAQVGPAQAGVEQRDPDQEQQHALGVAAHQSITDPNATAASTATANVTGANRTANPVPKAAICAASWRRSTSGPTTRKARRAVRENWLNAATTNASAAELTENRTASRASATTAKAGLAAIAASHRGGRSVVRAATANAPSTRKPPARTTSLRHESQKASHLLAGSCTLAPAAAGNHPGRPSLSQSRPRTTAAVRQAKNRAATISGCAGNATAVATRTTGLNAGAANSNVSAAAAATPLRIRAAAVGTAASLSVGRMAPATPATGTAATGVSGNSRRRSCGVRKVV